MSDERLAQLTERVTTLVRDPELAAWITDELIRCRALAEQLREAERQRDAFAAVNVERESDRQALAEQLRELREALTQIAQARPTTGVPLRDSLEGCASLARAALARGGTTE